MTLQEAIEMILKQKNAPEVQELAKNFNPLAGLTKDNVGEFIEKNEILKSHRDSFTTKSIETWKANNLQKLIDEGVVKANPEETPEQKQIRELKEAFNNSEAARKRETTRNIVIKTLTEKNLPVELADYLIGENEETTNANITAFEAAILADRKVISEGILKTNGRAPGSGKPNPNPSNPWKKESYNLTEQMKIMKNNPDLAKTLANEAGVELNT